MGREVRRVPADWQHPKDKNDKYVPLYDESFLVAARKWLDEANAWDRRETEDSREQTDCPFYWQWAGEPPSEDTYRPEFTSPATHYQMYENVSEGTPISPVKATPEELAQWLADHKESAGPYLTATYEQWLRMIVGPGSAPSFIIDHGVIKTGVGL